MYTKVYCCPQIVVEEYTVESGFVNSIEDPEFNPEIDW
jgi:hypothetical protein